MFWHSETWKLSTYPKQEAINALWDMIISPQSVSIRGPLCLAAFHIQRGRCLFILIGKVFQDLRMENKQSKVPRFLFILMDVRSQCPQLKI